MSMASHLYSWTVICLAMSEETCLNEQLKKQEELVERQETM